MNARRFIFVILICFTQYAFLNAETFVGRRMLTFDLSYLSTGLKYNGYGLGAKYEIQCFDFFSIRPGISHMVLFPKESDTVCVTVGVKVGIFFYPFFKGLEGFYIGSDFATDFCMFRGKSYENNESAITATPILGWKFSVLDYVFFDIFCGYQFLLNKGTFSHESLTNYYGNKFVYGLKMKLNLKKIWLSISDTAKKNAAKRAAKKASSIPQTESVQSALPESSVDEKTEETQTTSSQSPKNIPAENSQNTINAD